MKTHDRSEFYSEPISRNRSRTPEGFMVCHDVPIARLGFQQYRQSEIDPKQELIADAAGYITAERTEEEVFRTETMASFEGKPVTIGHPGSFVDPSNFGNLACGVTMNVRRGEGANSGFMMADLLITTQAAIDTIEHMGIREVSCGYDTRYEQVEPGRAVQRDIVGNHVALVARGRCGPSCSIGDEDMASKNSGKSWGDRFRAVFRSKDEAEAEMIAKEMDEAEEEEAAKKKKEEMADCLKPVMDAIAKIRDDFEEFKKGAKKEETEDLLITAETASKIDQNGVKLYTGDAARTIAQRAEILSPGFKVATFDAQTTDAQRAQALCGCERKALALAYATPEGKEAIDPFLEGRTIDALPANAVHGVFVAASEVMKARNNGQARATVDVRDFGKRKSLDEMNKEAAAFYGKRKQA